MFVLNQQRSLILHYKDDDSVDEIPVTYYSGSFWDKDMNEYAFAEEKREYWDNFYKDEKVRMVIIPSFEEDGTLKVNHKGMTMYEWKFVPYDMPKALWELLMEARETKDKWQKEVWDATMGRYREWRKR